MDALPINESAPTEMEFLENRLPIEQKFLEDVFHYCDTGQGLKRNPLVCTVVSSMV